MDRGRQEKTVTLLTGFRQYLHYHLKATKTYMHMRMRKRVVGLLQGESDSDSVASNSSASCRGLQRPWRRQRNACSEPFHN